MDVPPVSVEQILGEMRELPADGMDDTGGAVLQRMRDLLAALEGARGPVTASFVARCLGQDPAYLDVFRLFFRQSQDAIAHRLGLELGRHGFYDSFRTLARKEPDALAEALDRLGLPALIEEHSRRRWGLLDVLQERYILLRGRAVAGQKRGRGLEDAVEAVVKEQGVKFDRGQTFEGKDGNTAKADFAIPGTTKPKIVIECKSFEATGSKLTDLLGDIEKIQLAKGPHMYFFVVTDGQGWHNRVGDLKKLVEHQNRRRIDMIYTRRRLGDLGKAIGRIMTREL